MRGARTLCRFRRDSSGTSAIEFAMLAWPVILLLLAITEVGLVDFADTSLENAVGDAARMIRTGQAQTQGFDAGQFKAEVCKRISAPLDCGGIRLDVRHFSSFGGSQLTNPLNPDGTMKTNFSYDPGVGGDVVVVRGFYEWAIAARLPKPVGLSNMANGDRLLMATAAFRNEPFKLP
jgi:Flp pilus assembly protein TadG